MMRPYAQEERRTLNLLFPALVFTLFHFVGVVHSRIWQQNELPMQRHFEGRNAVLLNTLTFLMPDEGNLF